MVTDYDLIHYNGEKTIEVSWEGLIPIAYEVIDENTYGRLDIITLRYFDNMAYMLPLMIFNNINDITSLSVGRLVVVYTKESMLSALSFIDVTKLPGVNDTMISDNIKYDNDPKVIMTKINKERRLDSTRSVGVNGITLKKVSVSGNKIIF
jgi:hypothetical protein